MWNQLCYSRKNRLLLYKIPKIKYGNFFIIELKKSPVETGDDYLDCLISDHS